MKDYVTTCTEDVCFTGNELNPKGDQNKSPIDFSNEKPWRIGTVEPIEPYDDSLKQDNWKEGDEYDKKLFIRGCLKKYCDVKEDYDIESVVDYLYKIAQ